MKKSDLHDYQRFATDFIIEHAAAAILLDCGCGKTIITLTAIKDLLFDRFEVQKVLVICPIRVAGVWAEEIGKWEHLQGLRFSICVGTEIQRRRALSVDADIYVINRDIVPWLVTNYSSQWIWDMLVIDELSSFKNPQAKRFKSLLKMRPRIKRIVGLTGTPSSNGLMDLWAEYRLLDLGERLGRFIGAYRAQYFRPEKTNGVVVFSYAPLPGAEERIYNRIADMTVSLRCTDDHEAIIPRDEWDAVQLELARRDEFRKRHRIKNIGSSKYDPFYSRVFCARCGGKLIRKHWKGVREAFWKCENAEAKNGKSCLAGNVIEENLKKAVAAAWNGIVGEREERLPDWERKESNGNALERYRAKLMTEVTADGPIEKKIPELTRMFLEEIEVESPTEIVVKFLDGSKKKVRI